MKSSLLGCGVGECWLSMNTVVTHSTGHSGPCLEYQYWGSKAGSGVQSHPQPCGEFEASLSYIKLSKKQNLSTIYLAHTRLCSLLINSLIFRKCPITRSLKFNKQRPGPRLHGVRQGFKPKAPTTDTNLHQQLSYWVSPRHRWQLPHFPLQFAGGLLVFTDKKTIMWQRRGLTRSESHRLLFIHGICKFHQNTIFPLGGHWGRNNTGQVLGNESAGHPSTNNPYMLISLMFNNFLKTKAAQLHSITDRTR